MLKQKSENAFRVLRFDIVTLFVFFFLYWIHFPFTRKRIISLYFGRYVRTRLGVAISEVSGPSVFYIKVGVSRGLVLPKDTTSTLPKDTTSELAGLFSTTSHKCRSPTREAKNLLVWLDKGIKPQVYRLRSGRSNHYTIASLLISP